MANIYTRNTDGANADNGTTWALANLDLGGTNGSATDAVAGDTVFVSQAHAESTGTAIVIAFAGTITSPVKVLCANDAAEPPTALATTATVTSTSNITVTGCGYFYGINFRPGSGGSATQSFFAGTAAATNNQIYDNCSFNILATGTGTAKIVFGDEGRTDAHRFWVRNSTFRLGGVNHRIKAAGHFRIENGSFISGGANPVNVFETGLRGIGEFLVVGLDLSANIGSAFNLLIQNTGGNSLLARFHGLKLPTAWSGRPWSAKPTAPGIRAEITDSLIGTTRLRAWMEDYAGESRDETVIVRTGGSVDDVDAVPISVKMISSANAEYPAIVHKGVPISYYENSSGSPVTKYVEIVHDSQGAGSGAAMRNDEIALEVTGPSGFTSSVKADVLATATDHATSSETWTTTGLTTPVKQRMAITFTPPRKGEYTITPVLYAASKTVYYCLETT